MTTLNDVKAAYKEAIPELEKLALQDYENIKARNFIRRTAKVAEYLNYATVLEDIEYHGFLQRDYHMLHCDKNLPLAELEAVETAYAIYCDFTEVHYEFIQEVVDKAMGIKR